MTRQLRALVLVATGVIAACGGQGAPLESEVDGISTSEEGLTAFVKAGSYRSWTADPAIRAPVSNSPHGRVRVFFNPKLEASLRAGNATHPKGAMSVKEIFTADDTLTDAAILFKTAEGSGKDTWTFWEASVAEGARPIYGVGNSTCHGCHAAGRDYVTSPLP